jgi:dTDP-4-amino-4,6-dideoxygalactose transaminase
MKQVPVFKPLLEQNEREAAVAAIDLGWLGMGSYVAEFEKQLSAYLGLTDRRLAAVNTGHSALHLAMVVANLGPGDEVITPSFNCVSDFQAIMQVGAEPVLCDIRDDNLTIDVAAAERLVTPRTKAVVIMDYGNGLCDFEAVQAFADRHGLRVIHDAAHSMACRHKGRMIGSFSDITMLSFDPVKTVTCLDGGAIIVKSEEELHRIHELRILGMGQPPAVMYQNKRAWTFHVNDIGFRYHMINMHGAIGLGQLAKIDRISASRRATCRYYMDRLSGIPDLRFPRIDLENVTPFIFYVRVPGEERDAFRTYMHEHGVDTGVHWMPGHSFGLLRHCRMDDLTVTRKAAAEIVTLPLHSCMEEAAQAKVADTVVAYFREGRAARPSGANLRKAS